ncbi:MAG: hypothetical protein NC180_05035 [Muribaculaceae bacterium]|nr:hypothetical protein [Roseburia sp.]MCM1431153.1 hypothetical protein [Muribaculaceae bacterium]MCM1492576.1 hypothetical protein [Muribaculaceae bacterium]
MKKIREYGETMSEIISITRKEQTLLLVIAALAGCVLGMLVSPRKSICCGNGNGAHHHYGVEDMEEEE